MNAMTFPFAALAAPIPDATLDRAEQIAMRVGEAVARLAPEAGIIVSAVAAVALAEPLVMVRGDGMQVAIGIAPELAEALATAQFGGSFSAGTGIGTDLSPTVRRAQRTLAHACLGALDQVWSAEDVGWQPGTGAVSGRSLGFEVTTIDFKARIDLVLAMPNAAAAAPAAGETRADAAWQRGMRALIGATGLPLRAVLLERQLPLAQAVQLAPGDVLPIEAPRDVQLRIGTHKIARGTIAPLGDDGALLVTITSRRPDPALLENVEVLS